MAHPPPRRTVSSIGSQLNEVELSWRTKQFLLESHGYALRSRLRLNWTPSWLTNGRPPQRCEDFWKLIPLPNVVDATRMSDGLLVYIKRIPTDDKEIAIATYLSSPSLRRDPRNHSVPILDLFADDVDPSISYIVMPFLRPLDNPPFEVVEDVVDFVDQVLEGLVFLHEQGIAHRDCASGNILMHAASMYPKGFHPLQYGTLPDASGKAPCIGRLEAYPPVRYYYIDFGISVRIPPDVYPKLATGVYGLDQEVPELSITHPYDPFLVDVFILGNVFKNHIHRKYSDVGFLVPLFEAMTQQRPADRPNATQALKQWRAIRASIWLWQRGRSLQSSKEDGSQRKSSNLLGFLRLWLALSRRLMWRVARLWAVLAHGHLLEF